MTLSPGQKSKAGVDSEKYYTKHRFGGRKSTIQGMRWFNTRN